MKVIDLSGWILVAGGGLVMVIVFLRGIGLGAVVVAGGLVEDRRRRELQEKADNAAAEATGRAAGLEPLALNADGTIEEPIVGIVESR